MQTLFDAPCISCDLLGAAGGGGGGGGGSSVGPGVVCLLIPWSQISDPLLDSSAAPPLQLSSYAAVCLSGLSVLTDLSVCHFDPVCLFSGPLLLICLSVALSDLLAPGR